MTKKEYEQALRDPWEFALNVIRVKGISSKDVAVETGVPRSTVRSYLNGQRQQPRYPQLKKLVAFALEHN